MAVEDWQEVFQFYSEDRNRQYVSRNLAAGIRSMTEKIRRREAERWERVAVDLKERHVEVVHAHSKYKVTKVVEEGLFIKVFYYVWMTWRLKQSKHQYEQAWVEHRMCLLKNDGGWLVVEDELVEKEGVGLLNHPMPMDASYEIRNPNERRARYDRKKAVEYAERWWNDYNPKFREFEVDCTNYISQCLWAGGSPMKHSSDRAKGWWYRFEEPVNWSFSWAVAHSLRWYLPTSRSGLRGKEVSSADQLEPGDIICYDFDGDGRWQHNTIVVDKDAAGMPLVNAHTSNSRQRYWSYKDSYAWTEKTTYKFFKIQNDF